MAVVNQTTKSDFKYQLVANITSAAERLCWLTKWNFFERDSVVASQNFVTPKQCSGHADSEK